MTAVVPVVHPGVLRHTPPRSAQARTAVVRLVTAAEVPSVPSSAFVPIAGGGVRVRAMGLRDGVPWIRLQVGYGRSAQPVPAPAFLSWLRGEDAGPFQDAIPDLLRGTPLVAAKGRTEGGGYHQMRGDRGEVEAPAGLGEIHHDGRAGAAMAVADFLANAVALSGDGVMVRCRPVAAPRISAGMLHASLEPRPLSAGGRPPRLGEDPIPFGAAEILRVGGERRAASHTRDLAAYAEALARTGRPGASEDDELHFLANVVPGILADQFHGFLRRSPAGEGETLPQGVAGSATEMRRLAMRGMTGLLAGSEAHEALASCLSACEVLLAHGPAYMGRPVRAVAVHLREALPRLAPLPDPEDVAALAAFAPR